MRDYFTNPFDRERDPVRHLLWDKLVARDSEAFVAKDWSRVGGDFDRDRFEGITANDSANPRDWKVVYPTLEPYRDDWLRAAEDFVKMPLAHGTPRDLIYKLTTMDHVEIAGDRALCHKKFVATEALKSGARYIIASESLFRMHRIRGEWKVAGFISDLPLAGFVMPS
jgi:hypothetical protein